MPFSAISSVKSNAKLIWSRITLSKITLAYFFLALAHALVQVLLQADAFSINNDARHFLSHIIQAAKVDTTGFSVLIEGGPMYQCTDIPAVKALGSIKNAEGGPCKVVWSVPLANGSSPIGDDASPSGVIVAAYGSTEEISASTPTSQAGTTSSLVAAIVTSSVVSSPTVTSAPTATASATTASLSSVSSVARVTKVVIVTVEVPAVPATATVSSSRVPFVSQSATSKQNDAKNNASDDVKHGNDDGGNGNDIDKNRDDDDVKGHQQLGVLRSLRTKRGLAHTVGAPVFDSNGKFVSITTSGLNSSAPAGSPMLVTLSPVCVQLLSWPVQKLADSGREDLVFMAFHIWAAGMSIVALLNESMPHIIAAVLTHLLTTAWTGYQIQHTAQFKSEFKRVTQNGACRGADLLPGYWKARSDAELPALVLNCVALILSVWLSWRLIKQFGWQTFKRIGASMTVNYVYKLVLGLSIVLQLSLFFIVTFMALWIDQICSSPIGMTAIHSVLYKTVYIVLLVFLVPWVACGWFGVRREQRITTAIFLGGAVLLMAGWGTLFSSDTFRMIFSTWRFFAMIAIIAIILSAVTFILGVLCRLNFGKNSMVLANYLRTEDEKTEDFDQLRPRSEVDPEKGERFEFPSNSDVPTYDAMFANNDARDGHARTLSNASSTRSSSSGSRSPQAPPLVHNRSTDDRQRGQSRSEWRNTADRSSGSSWIVGRESIAPMPRVITTGYTLTDGGPARNNSVRSTSSVGSNRDPFAYDSVSPDGSAVSPKQGGPSTSPTKRWVIE